MKPYAEACERNRDPILAVLKRWQASDVAEHLAGIRL